MTAADDLLREIEDARRLRGLEPQLEELVIRSPMLPEQSWQQATLRWLRTQTPEARRIFEQMLRGIELRADYEAQDEALVDRILDQHMRRRD